jgi:cell division protein FtsL
MQVNLESIMKDMTNGLKDFHQMQARAMSIINQHLPELKNNPNYAEIQSEIEAQTKRIDELKQELKKCQ